MLSESNRNRYLAILSLLTILGRFITSKECSGNYPLVSGFQFSVLDYQMRSNSNDSTLYEGMVFEEDSENEMLISYEGRIGADYYRGWCSESIPTEKPFLQVDFKRELKTAEAAARYIRGFWLAYSNSTAMSYINVTQPNSSVTMIFSGQNEANHTASVIQDLPQPITARIVRLYPTESIPMTKACLKLELHGCVPQREEECQSVYSLSCCSYGQPGDIISTVEVTSDDPSDSVPGPVTNILGYCDSAKFWCGHRDHPLPINATFHFTEEVLLTSVAFHGLDGPLGDDYVTQYSWEYSVGNSKFETYTDLGNNTVFENTREDKFQQTFWTPIHVQTLKFVALNKAIRPCMAFQFFGCKLREVISHNQPQMSTTVPLSPTSTFSISTVALSNTSFISTGTVDPSIISNTTPVTFSNAITPQCPSCSMILSTTTSGPTASPTPPPQDTIAKCIGDEEPLISGIHYYVSDGQLSASGHDPLHYSYSNINERVLLTPEEARIGNMYTSFLGWCSQIVTNIKNNAPYIQVDFGAPVMVSAVAVQGFVINNDRRQYRYVHKYELAYKDLESEEFCIVNDENNQSMIFIGNSDANYLETIKYSLNKQIRAKVFRLYPTNWTSKAVVNDFDIVDTGRACLKWELYGCVELKTRVQNACYPKQSLLSNSDVASITSNSGDAVATSSLLHFTDSNDNWCPSTEGIDLPLVIDFSFTEEVLLISMAIAGKKTNNVDLFVSSYSLSYATNASCNLTLYEDLSGQSVFYNNHVRVFFHSFWKPLRVHQLQLLVTDWHVTPCLSIGFFGCKSSEVYNSSTAVVNIPSQNVCNAPTNNVLLSCVSEQRESYSSGDGYSDDNTITIVFIVLTACLAVPLLIIMTVLVYNKFRARWLRFKQSHSYFVNNPIVMQSENPIYEGISETKKKYAMKNDGKYENYCEERVNFITDDPSHYSKLHHIHQDDGAFSSSPYSVLRPQASQNYGQEGPKESTSSVAYEEIPYYEIPSKSD